MKLLVVNYAGNVEANVRFYRALGIEVDQEVALTCTEGKASGGVMAIYARDTAQSPQGRI